MSLGQMTRRPLGPAWRARRRHLAGLVAAAGGLAAVLATAPAVPATAATMAPMTAASGGGCATFTRPDSNIATLQACVSENPSFSVVSDMHLQQLTLKSCSFTISVRDDTLKGTVARRAFTGCGTAPGSVPFPAASGHQYHTYLQASFAYTNGTVINDPTVYNSPEQTVGDSQHPTSGGGCATFTRPDSDIAQLQACISENPARQVVGDMHLQQLTLKSCSFTVSTRDDTLKTTVARQTFTFGNCTATPGSITHPAVDGHQYHTYLQGTFTYTNGTVIHDPVVYGSPEQVAGVPTMVNPLYTQAAKVAFGALSDSEDARATYPAGTLPATADDGILVARLFIPDHAAAGGILIGDNRGFSSDPNASTRGTLAWNTKTGGVSLTVSHTTESTTMPFPITGISIPALPVTKLAYNADYHQDVRRSDNEVGINTAAGSNVLQARLSMLNPVTNNGMLFNDFGAWSVDYQLTIARTAANTYRVTQMVGNGYPAIEIYYYPHMIPVNAGPTQADVVAKRAVAPLFVGLALDGGGGVAAVDFVSWNTCGYLPGTLTISCKNTAPYSNAQQSAWKVLWGPHFPSQSQWTTPWNTPASASSAF